MNGSNQVVALRQDQFLAPTTYAMPVEELIQQVQLIQQVMKAIMKKDKHYGTIPGCGDKPTLLKPGAEKLAMTFRLAPKYEIQERDLNHGHREYRVECSLHHIVTGAFVGMGLGAGSTMEGKYRFRQEVVPDASVTKEYWETRDSDLLGGPNRKPQKRDGKWVVVERVDHDNPADYYNTVLKMAQKRALVAAVLTATGASDIFTQDLEDMDANGVAPQGASSKAASAPPSANHSGSQANPSQKAVSEKQINFLLAEARKSTKKSRGSPPKMKDRLPNS